MTRHQYILDLNQYSPSPSPLLPLSPFLLRAPIPADLPALAELMIDAYTGTIDYDGETIEDARGEVQSYFNSASGGPLFNASWLCFDGKILASAILVSFWEGAPLVTYVMTSARYKGRGLARALLHKSLSSLKVQSHSQVRAFITEGNTPSETIFKSIGFQLQN